MPSKNTIKVIIIPGNGGSKPTDNWYGWVAKELTGFGIKTINREFPDSILARAKFWLPFLEELGADQNAILIGHSSGALAAMRYAETHQILGSVLVGACYTDLGVESEKLSGYYDKPWDWVKIRKNQNWILQFAAFNDPFIPVAEPRHIHQQLQTEYYESATDGHFGAADGKTEFPEIIRAITKKLKL